MMIRNAHTHVLAIALAVVALPMASRFMSPLSAARGVTASDGQSPDPCKACDRWQKELQQRTEALDRAQADLDAKDHALATLEDERSGLQRQLANALIDAPGRATAIESQIKNVDAAANDASRAIQKLRDLDLPDLRAAINEAENHLNSCKASCARPLRDGFDTIEAKQALCPECISAESGCNQVRVDQLDRQYAELSAQFDKRSAEPLPPEMPDRGNEAASRERMRDEMSRLMQERNRAAADASLACQKLAECNRQRCTARETTSTTSVPATQSGLSSPLDPPASLDAISPGPPVVPPFVPPSVAPRADVPENTSNRDPGYLVRLPETRFSNASPPSPIVPETFWQDCLGNDSCPPVTSDPFIPGFTPPGFSLPDDYVNLGDAGAWTTSIRIEIEIRVQAKVFDVVDPGLFPSLAQPAGFNGPPGPASPFFLSIPPAEQPRIREWFDPFGLLAQTVTGHVQRWRGSMGPRPLLTTRDLDVLDRVSNAQGAGLPKGVHVLLTDRGGSTGRTLTMQVLNLTGKPVRLLSKPFAVEPIKQQAQSQVTQAFTKLSSAAPVKLNLSAYCVEFLKAPPGANQLLRLAPSEVQQKYEPMSKVLQSGYRVAKAGALHPDSNPSAYADSIKQWSLWTVEQNFNEKRFTEAFIAHTKKNVEAAGQNWPPQAEQQIRQVAPNRWRDIALILRGAGVAVPQ